MIRSQSNTFLLYSSGRKDHRNDCLVLLASGYSRHLNQLTFISQNTHKKSLHKKKRKNIERARIFMDFKQDSTWNFYWALFLQSSQLNSLSIGGIIAPRVMWSLLNFCVFLSNSMPIDNFILDKFHTLIRSPKMATDPLLLNSGVTFTEY